MAGVGLVIHRLSGRTCISALCLVALATTLAGCGSDSSDGALSSEGYAAAVTRICTSNAGELRRLVTTSGGDFLASKGDEFVELTNKNLARLKRLRPPPELERQARRLIVYAEVTRDRLIVLVRAAKKRPGTVDLGSDPLLDARRRMIGAASDLGASC